MAKPKRIYLAGPEVFFPSEEHQAIVAEKKRLLRDSGGRLFVADQPGEHRFFSAELFRRCVRALADA